LVIDFNEIFVAVLLIVFECFVQVRTVSKHQLELLREAVHDVSPFFQKL